jgi:hypothetical protein
MAPVPNVNNPRTQLMHLFTNAALAAAVTIGASNLALAASAPAVANVSRRGEAMSVTLCKAAGDYVLLCNYKNHYELGMATAFTVTN